VKTWPATLVIQPGVELWVHALLLELFFVPVHWEDWW